MKRISTFAALILLVGLAGLMNGFAQSGGTGATAVPDHVTLTWTGDPVRTMTITWRTDAAVTTGVVQYQAGSALSDSAEQANAVPTDFATDRGATRLFTATLTGLSSSTKYTYRAGDGEHWSDLHAFTTAAAKPGAFKFLVFGDSQSSTGGDSPYGDWRRTVQNAYKANPGAKFMVNVGDLVGTGQSCEHWNAWFSATTGVIDSIPEMPVLGNHEYAGGGGPSYWIRQFPLPQNGPEGLKSRVYSYDYGRAHLVVLDSEKAKGDSLDALRKWLDADLSASNATWKIVFFHKAPYEVKDGRSNQALRDAFCPTMESHHVDLVFNGHDHGISRTWPINKGVFKQKPSQGTIYFVTGRSGGKTYKDLSKREWNAFFHNPLHQPNYLVVEVSDAKLTVKTLNQDGSLVDTFFIDKAKDETSDRLKLPAPVD
jgi:hypothetical protein